MSESPHISLLAASFDWETLLPLIFFVLYGLAQFLGSKKKGDAVEEDSGQEEDPMEKARQIREEIRRKIEQRKEDSGKQVARERQDSGRNREYDPTVPESGHSRRESSSQSASPKRPVVVHQAQPVSTQPQVPGIQKRLQEQQKRLQEARKQHEAAMVQARKMTREASVRRQSDSRKLFERHKVRLDNSTQLREAVISGLRNPNSLRKAVLYREILDPPLGLR